MTYEEKMSAIQSALKSINYDGYIDIANHGCPDERNELEVIKEALEKQVSKKPYAKRNEAICPNCGQTLTEFFEFSIKTPCCDRCGQAIDWSD